MLTCSERKENELNYHLETEQKSVTAIKEIKFNPMPTISTQKATAELFRLGFPGVNAQTSEERKKLLKKILWWIINHIHWSIQIRTIIIAAAVTIDSVVTLIAVILLPAVVSLSIKHLIAAVVVVLAD